MNTPMEREQQISMLFAEASAKLNGGENDESLALVRKALQIEFNPHTAGAYILRANLYTLKISLMLDRAASEADLKDLKRYRTLYARIGLEDDVAKALADYFTAMQLDPGCVDAYKGRSLLYKSIGSLEGFEADNQRVAEWTLDHQSS
jgi:hypothetical protein